MKDNFTQNTTERMRFHNRSTLNLPQVFGMSDIRPEKNNFARGKQLDLSYLRNFSRLILILCVSLLSLNVSAQITEHFTSETGKSFSEGGFSFSIAGSYLSVANGVGWGWTGTTVDNYYVDNYGVLMPSAGIIGSITNSSKNFYVHSMYLAPGDISYLIGQYGNVIIRGKLNGTTQFTYTLLSANINNNQPVVINNSYTYVDLSSYSTTVINQIEFELTNNLRYLAIDAFIFSDASNVAPTVTTQAVTSIAVTTATGNGNITSLGAPNPTAYGVCWNTTGTPTTSDSKVDKGAASVTGAFTASMTSLTANTTYYVRAFATNTAGPVYGTQESFKTLTANNAPTDISITTSSVNENVAGNTTVGALSTTDPDVGNTHTYSLVSGSGDTDNASFSISGNSLRITNSPNYETKNSYSVRIQTSDGSLTYEKSFTITINDLNEAPAITSNGGGASASINASENSTAVTTVTATDVDASTTLTYSMTGGADQSKFSINSSTGVLTFASAPNFESPTDVGGNNVYDVTVTVSDGTLTDAQNITVTVQNVNETPTNITITATTVNENQPAGTAVGVFTTTDVDATDTHIYALVSGAGDTDNTFFNISSNNLNISSSPDFETKNSYSVRVSTTDQGSLAYDKVFTITINDLNDVIPVITASQELHVTEQSPNGTTVGTVLATDGDVTTTTFQNWTITAGNSNGYFAVNSSTGVITVVDNTGLDPNVNQSFTLTLTVSDGVNTSSSQTVSIIVAAINDENPVITPSQSFAIDENSANGAAVGQVLATDPDYGTVFQGWTITAGNTDNAFAINSITGAITVNTSTALDYETTHSFSLTIQVSDGLHTASGVVTVNLNNLNDNTPNINGSIFTLDENSANGTAVGAIVATDADGALNNLTFSFVTKISSPFAVNLTTGAITVNNSSLLDYENINTYSLTIQVSDGVHTANGLFTINLNNLNDNAPTVTPATFAIDENSANGTAVGTAVATDADGTLNSLTYTITSGNTNSAFAINPTTGAITVNKTEEINFEVTPVFNLTVTASDGTLSGSANVRINLNDVVETGIEDNKSFSIKVYPNPAEDKVSVSLDHLTSGSYTIEVLSIIGNKVYQREVNTPSEIQVIDLTGFAEGIYFVKAYNKQFSFTERLVIH